MNDVYTHPKAAPTDALDIVRDIRRGAVVARFGDKIQEAVSASQQFNKKAVVTLTLTLEPDQKTETMRVTGRVSAKIPEEPEKAAVFFVGDGGTLSRQDSRQAQIFPEDDA